MKRILNIFFISILMVIALTACGGKEATPAPVPTPEPINLAAKEPTADPMDACAAGISLPLKTDYPLVFCDNFEDPGDTQMDQIDTENKWGALTTSVYDGKYTARVEVKRDNAMWLPLPTDAVRDFVLQVDGKLTSHSGHPYHSWGVYFKADDETKDYYYFLIDNNQFYYFQLVRGDRATNLINGRKSEDLNPLDELNTITVVAEGSTYSFYINGKLQEDFSDNRLLSGKVGIYSEMRENTTLDWEFDNMVLYAK